MGVPNFLTSKGCQISQGVLNILGYCMEWGCQISWDAKYSVTPEVHVHDKNRALRPVHGVASVGGHRKVAIQPELKCSFSLQSCSCTQDSTDTAKPGAIALDLRKYFCKA